MQVRLYLCKVTNNKSKKALNGALMKAIYGLLIVTLHLK